MVSLNTSFAELKSPSKAVPQCRGICTEAAVYCVSMSLHIYALGLTFVHPVVSFLDWRLCPRIFSWRTLVLLSMQ